MTVDGDVIVGVSLGRSQMLNVEGNIYIGKII